MKKPKTFDEWLQAHDQDLYNEMGRTTDVSKLASDIQEMLTRPTDPVEAFSLEPGQGETYSSNRPTLYAHSTYGRSSVLAGRERREFVEMWNSWAEARTALDEVKKKIKRFKYDDFGEQGGTSHIPIDMMVSHLPDDTDY